MSTWHQDAALRRNPFPFYHPTLYTAVIDPPGECRCFVLFKTKAEAQEYKASCAQFRPQEDAHVYILPPMSSRRV